MTPAATNTRKESDPSVIVNNAELTKEAMRAMGIEGKDAEKTMDAVILAKAMYDGSFEMGMLGKLFGVVEWAGNTEIAQKMMTWGLTRKAEEMASARPVEQARAQWIAMADDEKEALLMSAISWKGRLKMATMKSTAAKPIRTGIEMKNWLQSQVGRVWDSATIGPDQLMLDEVWEAVLMGIFPVKDAMLQRVFTEYLEDQARINQVANLAKVGGTLTEQPEVSLTAELAQFGIKMDTMLMQRVLPNVRARMAEKYEVTDTAAAERMQELRAAGQEPAEA